MVCMLNIFCHLQVLGPLRGVSPAYARVVDEVFALVAYECPAESPLAHLMGPVQRERVADIVNLRVLLSQYFPEQTFKIGTHFPSPHKPQTYLPSHEFCQINKTT